MTTPSAGLPKELRHGMGVRKPYISWALPGLYVLLSPGIPISIRYLNTYYDLYTMNAVRHWAGAIILLLIAALRYRKALRDAFCDWRQLAGILLLVVLNVLAVYVYTIGLVTTSATLAQMITVLALPLTVVLAIALFPDERALTQRREFWIGTGVSLVGTVGISCYTGQLSAGSAKGILLLLLYVLIYVVFGMLVKRLVADIPSPVVAAASIFWVALAYTLASMCWGSPATVLQTPPFAVSVLVLSGIFGILVGAGLAYLITEQLGVIVFQFTGMVIPFITAVLEYLLLGERMTWAQLGFGALLVLGCAMTLRISDQGSMLIPDKKKDTAYSTSTK